MLSLLLYGMTADQGRCRAVSPASAAALSFRSQKRRVKADVLFQNLPAIFPVSRRDEAVVPEERAPGAFFRCQCNTHLRPRGR